MRSKLNKPMIQFELYSGGKIYICPEHIESVTPKEGNTIHIVMRSGTKHLVVDTENSIPRSNP